MISNTQHSVINIVDINTRDTNALVQHLQHIEKLLNVDYPLEFIQANDTVADTIASISKVLGNSEYLYEFLKEKFENSRTPTPKQLITRIDNVLDKIAALDSEATYSSTINRVLNENVKTELEEDDESSPPKKVPKDISDFFVNPDDPSEGVTDTYEKYIKQVATAEKFLDLLLRIIKLLKAITASENLIVESSQYTDLLIKIKTKIEQAITTGNDEDINQITKYDISIVSGYENFEF